MRNTLIFLSIILLAAASANATDLNGSLTADNGFMVFVSTDNNVLGTEVASGGNWGSTYNISGITLTPGVTNYLQIEAVNWGGARGFIGNFSLSDSGFQFANGTQYLVTEPGEWLGIYNNGNSTLTPQAWVTPSFDVFSEGYNGVGPWGFRSGVDANAQWIWPSDNNSPGCDSCTVDLFVTLYPTGIPEPGTVLMFGSGIAAVLGALRRRLIP